ncbi:MAG: ATP synthase F0 subunit B [Proteobacteria bacterium]|jgi:F-type H+-transporting ATPase subunit b|nr:ATP synthase F0 subunit B [Pseudomonadota bacterium]
MRALGILILMATLPAAALAAGKTEGVPWGTVAAQAFNVSLLFGGLFYFLRTPVKNFFANKKTNFVSAAEKSQAARKAAEDERMEIQVRLTKLESTADETISRARAEASDMKKQLIAEAKNLSEKLRQEAQAAAKIEIEKAKNSLRSAMIQDAAKLAREEIGTKLSGEDHSRLQGQFIQNIQAVHK